ERQTVGCDLGGRRQCLFYPGQGRVNQLQRVEHVYVPVEEEAYFRRAAAGDRTDRLQARNAVDRLFDRSSNRDLHLLDRHYAVIDADDDSWKVRLWEDGDGHLKGEIDAGKRQGYGEEIDRSPKPGNPEGLPFRGYGLAIEFCAGCLRTH